MSVTNKLGTVGILLVAASLTVGLDRAPVSVPTVIIGGSAAKGWHDRTSQGYISRALAEYEGKSLVHFVIHNHAMPGAPVTDGAIAHQFPEWMEKTKGGLVVIAWGLLNDIRLHTSDQEILAQVRREIRWALETDHEVLVVSPPATLASFTFDSTSQVRLWGQIASVARSFHDPRVNVVNVLGPMMHYVRQHHQNPRWYMKGKWDPDTRGHVLASHFLLKGLGRVWGRHFPQIGSR